MDLPALSSEMLAECERTGQSSRVVEDPADVDALRALLRFDTRDGPMRIRTGVVADTVVVIRTDAALWDTDAATMRRELPPPDRRDGRA